MKLKLFAFLLLLFVCISCAENYGCAERITVPDNVLKNGNELTFEPSYWIDLPCDYDLSSLLDVSEVLPNFSYEIISYNYIADTGNNTSKLQFEVILKNNNNFEVEGLPIFVMRKDGLENSENYRSSQDSCSIISANETCTLTYEKETSFDIEKVKSLELVSVKFLLAK